MEDNNKCPCPICPKMLDVIADLDALLKRWMQAEQSTNRQTKDDANNLIEALRELQHYTRELEHRIEHLEMSEHQFEKEDDND